jgi:hypothetical protein
MEIPSRAATCFEHADFPWKGGSEAAQDRREVTVILRLDFQLVITPVLLKGRAVRSLYIIFHELVVHHR